jgi:DNA-directed RNA polymerase sigma subunit (sigma70/sigma32)
MDTLEKQLRWAYESGRTLSEIAQARGLSVWKVRQLLRQAGTTMRRTGPRGPRKVS